MIANLQTHFKRHHQQNFNELPMENPKRTREKDDVEDEDDGSRPKMYQPTMMDMLNKKENDRHYLKKKLLALFFKSPIESK